MTVRPWLDPKAPSYYDVEHERRPWLSEQLSPDVWFERHRKEFHLTLGQVKALRGADEPAFRVSGSGVYFLFLGDELQYVGMSRSMNQRIGSHLFAKEIPFDSSAKLFVCPVFASMVERYHIGQFQPPYNSHGIKRPDVIEAERRKERRKWWERK